MRSESPVECGAADSGIATPSASCCCPHLGPPPRPGAGVSSGTAPASCPPTSSSSPSSSSNSSSSLCVPAVAAAMAACWAEPRPQPCPTGAGCALCLSPCCFCCLAAKKSAGVHCSCSPLLPPSCRRGGPAASDTPLSCSPSRIGCKPPTAASPTLPKALPKSTAGMGDACRGEAPGSPRILDLDLLPEEPPREDPVVVAVPSEPRARCEGVI